jgi:hypothetical protein
MSKRKSFLQISGLAAIPAERRLLYAAVVALLSALVLRFVPSGLREAATACLGADGRAVLEHALAGFGVPALLSMMLLPETFGMRPAQRSLQSRRRARVIARLDLVLRCLVPVVCVVYLALSAHYEFGQAYISVNGGAARGYLQFGQLAGDAAGAWMTALLGLRVTAMH